MDNGVSPFSTAKVKTKFQLYRRLGCSLVSGHQHSNTSLDHEVVSFNGCSKRLCFSEAQDNLKVVTGDVDEDVCNVFAHPTLRCLRLISRSASLV